jgi:hypothetical protein
MSNFTIETANSFKTQIFFFHDCIDFTVIQFLYRFYCLFNLWFAVANRARRRLARFSLFIYFVQYEWANSGMRKASW